MTSLSPDFEEGISTMRNKRMIWLAPVVNDGSVTRQCGAVHTRQRRIAADPTAIVIKNFDFSPMTLTVRAGATVTWKNMDDEPHTITSTDGLFRSGALDQGDSFKRSEERRVGKECRAR